MTTIEEVLAFADRLRQVPMAAAAHGLRVGELIGHGSHAVVFAVEHDELEEGTAVLRLPLLWPDVQRSPRSQGEFGPSLVSLSHRTGPYLLYPLDEEAHARSLLEVACLRQRERPTDVLAELIDTVDLAGIPAAVHRRLGHRARPTAPEGVLDTGAHVARALQRLHATFGPHGDIKPAHLFLRGGGPDGDHACFIDPLVDPNWVGTVGYTLAVRPTVVDVETDRRVHDVGALVPVMMGWLGRTPGWDWLMLYQLLNDGVEVKTPGLARKTLHPRLDEGVVGIPEPLHGWLHRTGHEYVDICTEETPAAAVAGWAEGRLAALIALGRPLPWISRRRSRPGSG